ncbi:ImmA/IrrE family metallo-endopeptidase [Cohnella boryungensis]|uniref:ImmA/IrrE family metallo-endopeptidase n=2 Tax=Cohnella boryungensis TaxID=768479 RepID=A0ABV8SFS8_9BACL
MVKRIADKYDTNDPLQIASQKQILIFYENFKNIWGYFNSSRRTMMIHVNANLNEALQRFVIAHELGHRILHPNVNVPFLRSNTLHSIERIEREANQFAVELLIEDDLLLDGLTIYEAATVSGVPVELAYLKKIPR